MSVTNTKAKRPRKMQFSTPILSTLIFALGLSSSVLAGTTIDGTTIAAGTTIDVGSTNVQSGGDVGPTSASSAGMAPAVTAGVQAVMGMGLLGAAALL